ncbi:bifunctional DNA primase/polymerase [Pseudonocardia sp. DSM 110487]|uniref:bifunctional DNA primase/polymerase n=1 Tax=Pseudonocardia sp. DSM 110487 TaxID=2865833 RepID=UPI001C6A1BA4|nr:bifunctional DNA primase/polymerase [Pseudonocardia sp. DSM 110487]QYN35189.1 bifunctional DNA primase/polymerase [Pseudonocardia sp. DSM 110487]
MSTHSKDSLSLADRARLATWLDLAARGWHLFPVRPGRKTPAITRWQDRATTDPQRITRFFTDRPDHNAGIACGPSGLLVIDCDTPKATCAGDNPSGSAGGATGRDGWAVLAGMAAGRGGLPDTWTVATPSGGRHLYFRAPAPGPDGRPLGNTGKTLGPMLDTRGAGGQVLAPGSRLPNGGYELLDDTDPAALPGWLAWQLSVRAPTATSGPPERFSTTVGDYGAYVSTIVRAERQRVAQAPRGGHNAAVFTAARALGQLVGAGVLDPATVERDLLADAAHIITGPCDCTARDIAASIASGLAYGRRRPRCLPPPRAGTGMADEGRQTA